jgi:hypothetical protein
MVTIQHPYKPDTRIALDAMLGHIDKVFACWKELDKHSEHGIDLIGTTNRVLNDITARFTNEDDKAIFTKAIIERYIGEDQQLAYTTFDEALEAIQTAESTDVVNRVLDQIGLQLERKSLESSPQNSDQLSAAVAIRIEELSRV